MSGTVFPPRSWARGSPVQEMSVSMVGLTATSSRRTFANTPHPPCLLLPVPLTPQQTTADPLQESPKHRQVGLSLMRGPRPFPLGPGVHKVLFVPSKSLCFAQSCGSSVIKSRNPSNLGIPSPFARSPGWGVCCGTDSLHIRARTSLV